MRLINAIFVLLCSHVAALLVVILVAVVWAWLGSQLNGVDPNAPIDPKANPSFSPVTAALTTASLGWFITGWVWLITLFPALLLLPASHLLWRPAIAMAIGAGLGLAFALLVIGGNAQPFSLALFFHPDSLVFWRNGLIIGATTWGVATLMKRWLD